jgi:diadenylate cyclase
MEKLIKKNGDNILVQENQNSQEIIVPILENLEEKKLNLIDVLNKLSPGKSLRTALDDILEGKTGALIVVDCLKLKGMMDGGFRINTRFTMQRVCELAKMDGAIVLSADLKKILFANVLLVPDSSIPTNETGTRHKAAERTAKQAETLVIAVSERRNKISLFYGDKKYILEDSENLLRRATETLNILEKQKEAFDELLKNLNVLEITKLVSIADVCGVLQRIEVINKMMDTMRRYLIELGNQGTILRMRVRELFRDINVIEEQLLKDYSSKPQNVKKMLASISFDGIIDTDSLSRLLFESSSEAQISPKGYRILSKLNLTDREIKLMINEFENLSGIISSSDDDLDKILKAKTSSFRKEFEGLKEQILVGKKI